ncbi:MAG: DUF4846 domain-containing protein [Saprospiraceae bacterium]|nr:DUF4846 domain-containing protein [Saprospiraceae bacterium]
MMWIFLIVLSAGLSACQPPASAPAMSAQTWRADSIPPQIKPSGATVETRFSPPEGYERLPAPAGSFGAYLRQLPLRPDGSPVRLYDGGLKYRQDAHCAVIDLDPGRRNLQQCADAAIRLRAEYLFAHRRFSDIHFQFTNGFRADYARWRAGNRIRVDGKQVRWTTSGAPDTSRAAFRQYLDMVFAYAGTASLERELRAADLSGIQPGDVWIEGGYPGHAVIVLDVAEQPGTGARCFLLAQSYMPAQDIHVLKNPEQPDGNPWYFSHDIDVELVTPEWTFGRGTLRRWNP